MAMDAMRLVTSPRGIAAREQGLAPHNRNRCASLLPLHRAKPGLKSHQQHLDLNETMDLPPVDPIIRVFLLPGAVHVTRDAGRDTEPLELGWGS